ncbi:hypothetical protein [Microlunatus ginsengisoli]|uniref:hypothetical protein n=1 Tax=Microlunatus ginsengisoli TaxID=363863 RepID=UPI0031DAE4A5
MTLNNAPHGDKPGVVVTALEGSGRAAWAERGTVAEALGSWPNWDKGRADKTLASLGWRRIAGWTGGGGLWFARVQLEQGLRG